MAKKITELRVATTHTSDDVILRNTSTWTDAPYTVDGKSMTPGNVLNLIEALEELLEIGVAK